MEIFSVPRAVTAYDLLALLATFAFLQVALLLKVTRP